jgi:hypothetical protein
MPIQDGTKKVEMTVPLLVGEGAGPPTNTRRAAIKADAPKAPPESEPDTSSEEEEDGEDTKSKEKNTKDKVLTYQERLKKAGITEVHAREVMDAVLFGNDYRETISLRENFSVVLHTRSYADTLRLMRVIEAEAPTFPMHTNDIIARYNVCASLAQWGNNIFTSPPKSATPKEIEEDFDERLKFIFGLREIAINKLIDMVARFDKKMAIIFSEGSIEDF